MPPSLREAYGDEMIFFFVVGGINFAAALIFVISWMLRRPRSASS